MSDQRRNPVAGRRVAAFAGGFALVALGAALAGVVGSTTPASAAGVCTPAPAYLATAAGETIGGIGGTGRAVDSGEGGIGGTGIVGTITGFASVCVNGIEVHYDDKVPVSENGRPSSVTALAVGQVVALDVGSGRLGPTARRIEVMHALEGPVTKNEAGRLEVMGAAVIPADASLRGSVAPLQAGHWVQVNGHRDDAGRWVATRVVRIDERAEASVLAANDGAERVGGVRIDGARVGAGETKLLRGEWRTGGEEGGRLRVRESLAAPAGAMLERAERLIVETRVREVRDGRVRTGQPDIDAALSGRDLRAGELVRVRALRQADGKVRVERLERSEGRQGVGSPEERRREHGGKSGRDDADRAKDQNRGDRDARGADSDREKPGGRSDAIERGGQDKAERPEKSEKLDKPERPEKIEKNERTDRPERSERSEKTDRVERSDRVDRAERSEPRPEKKVRD